MANHGEARQFGGPGEVVPLGDALPPPEEEPAPQEHQSKDQDHHTLSSGDTTPSFVTGRERMRPVCGFSNPGFVGKDHVWIACIGRVGNKGGDEEGEFADPYAVVVR